MRYLFLAWRDLAHPQAGGSEIVVDRLACELRELGHDVSVVCGGPVDARPYPVYESGGRFTQYVKAPFVSWRRCPDADVVIDVSNGIPFFAPLWQRKPVVCWVHHVHEAQWRQHFPPVVARAGWFLEREIVPRLYRHGLFAVESPSTATALEELGIHADAIHLVQLGVDPARRTGSPGHEPLTVAIGRLVPHKRIGLLMQLWARVRSEVGGRLVVVGDGPELERLRALEVPDVELTGAISEEAKSDLLARATLLVHPAEHEGLGIVILEAAATGLPAVGYRVPGVRDAIDDGVTGFLADDDDQFVARWIELVRDGRLRDRMGLAAEAAVATATWRDAAIEVEAIARLAVDAHRGAR